MRDKMREVVLQIMHSYEQEMEHYGYYESNPGVAVEDFEDIANEIIAWQAAQAEQSAAPDLLEALEQTQSLLERLGLQSSDEYQANAAAIAKAKGEQ